MAEKKYTVKTPNPHFSGVRNGVYFEEGTGQASYDQAQQLVNRWRYSCEDLPGNKKADSTSAGKVKNNPIKALSKSSGFKKWQYAVELVKQIETVEAVEAFTQGDPRKSVNKAAAERIAELNSKAVQK